MLYNLPVERFILVHLYHVLYCVGVCLYFERQTHTSHTFIHVDFFLNQNSNKIYSTFFVFDTLINTKKNCFHSVAPVVHAVHAPVVHAPVVHAAHPVLVH